MPGQLGRKTPPDFEHVDKYPLSAAPPSAPQPVVLGIPWYSDFDTPIRRAGAWWVAAGGLKGTVRGGHAICLESRVSADAIAWWRWYDQGSTSACTGFATSRALTLKQRLRYQAYWVYVQAQILERETDRNAGAQVRDALKVLQTVGDVDAGRADSLQLTDDEISADRPDSQQRIGAYHWAQSVDEIVGALGTPHRNYVVLLNSWGPSYPHRVRLPLEVLDRIVFHEDGEAAVLTG